MVKEVDIPTYEAFITQTLQPRLEELLSKRDDLVKSKDDYMVTNSRLGNLLALRDKMRGNVKGNDDIDQQSKRYINENIEQRLRCYIGIGSGVSLQAISDKPIQLLTVDIEGVNGLRENYSLDEGVEFVNNRLDQIGIQIKDLDDDIGNVVHDIESCLHSVNQLRTILSDK